MTKFKLTSHKGTDRLPASIQVADAKGDLVCIIFIDGKLAPQGKDYWIEEMKFFISIAEKFHTFYEILEETAHAEQIIKEQDALIRQLEVENETYAKQSDELKIVYNATT